MEKEILFRIDENGNLGADSKNEIGAKDIIGVISHCFLILEEAGISLTDIASYSEAILNQMARNIKEMEDAKSEGEA